MNAEKLTGKQRRYLRSLGTSLKPVVYVGQKGVGETVLRAVNDAFNTAELVKVKVQEGFSGDRHEVAQELAAAAPAHLVQVLGRTILLYRRDDEHPSIELP